MLKLVAPLCCVFAELDALISLSIASSCIMGTTCKPIICCHSDKSAPLLIAKGLRHPILESSLDGGQCFVPNDINLGGENHAPFMLLTGPNMGGKSTLLRQVCLAIILAQVRGQNIACLSALFQEFTINILNIIETSKLPIIFPEPKSFISAVSFSKSSFSPSKIYLFIIMFFCPPR